MELKIDGVEDRFGYFCWNSRIFVGIDSTRKIENSGDSMMNESGCVGSENSGIEDRRI